MHKTSPKSIEFGASALQLLGCSAIIASLWAGTALAAPMSCAGLTPEKLGLNNVAFDDVTAVPAGEESPVSQCRIRATTAKRTGSDGHPYALRFELALPDNWNGDYVHQFNGGNDGEVKPATGGLGSGTGANTPLARGYAVVSSDAGHDGAANKDAGLAGGARFGFDEEARRMYGYGAVALLDPLARTAVKAYYGQDIGHAYGIGCSNGGRHAMVAAVRMPDAFDGLLIGAPGYDLPRAALQHALDVQSFAPLNGDIRKAFSPSDLALVSNTIRNQCDGLDGLTDGLVMDTKACQSVVDISGLQCKAEKNDDCLSAEQVAALKTVHAGPKDADGNQLYSDWAWDSGISGGNWRFWKLQSPIPPWDNLPLIAIMGSSSLAQVFTVPPTEVAGDPASLEKFVLGFDLAKEADKIYATSGSFPESAMDFMSPPDRDNPDLAAFKESGGKMILFHGVSDPVFSVNATAKWYATLDANNAGKAAEFAKFYPVPGMNHCSGGPATDDFDLLTPLVNWVEKGTAPEAVAASTRADNKDLPESLAGASRPLCPAPQVARYKSGDPKSAESFTCSAE